MFEHMQNSAEKKLKFETISLPGGDEMICCPERGGIIVSVKILGKEILYLEEDTLYDASKNVRGGVPVLFPNAGPIPDTFKNTELGGLEQHGFARQQEWIWRKKENGVEMILHANPQTRKVYPYGFTFSQFSGFAKDGSFEIKNTVENPDTERGMPVSFGLHPYFRVSNERKKDIKFDFPGGDYVIKNFDKWANGKSISIDNPLVPLEVAIPGVGNLVFNISPEYKRIWVWSMPGKDFICIEPVMRDKGGIISNPEMVKPDSKYSAKMNIKLREDKSV